MLLAFDPNVEVNFHDFVSFLTLFWARHLSIILKLLDHIIRRRGGGLLNGRKFVTSLSCALKYDGKNQAASSTLFRVQILILPLAVARVSAIVTRNLPTSLPFEKKNL